MKRQRDILTYPGVYRRRMSVVGATYGAGRYLARAAIRRLGNAAIAHGRNTVRAAAVNMGARFAARGAKRIAKMFKKKGGKSKKSSVKGSFYRGNQVYGGRFNRPNKVKYGPSYLCDTKGITFVQENGGTDATANRCITIGHASHPEAILERLLYGTIVRLILNRIGYATQNYAQGNSCVRTNDIVRINYRLNFDNTAIGEQFITYTCANDDTMTTIVTGMITQARLLAGKTPQLNFQYVEYISANDVHDGGRVKVNLVGASVYVYCNSTLTVQNRTDNGEASPTMEEIDTIPLVGKVYEGYGTGARLKWNPTGAGLSDLHQNPVASDAGMIIYGEGTASTLSEPLNPWAYSNVSKTNAVRLAAGMIKDSYISFMKTISLQRLIGLTYQTGASAKEYIPFGMYKFYMLEKHIEPSTGTPANPIRIAWQVNNKCGGYITLKRASAAVQENFIGSNLPLG